MAIFVEHSAIKTIFITSRELKIHLVEHNYLKKLWGFWVMLEDNRGNTESKYVDIENINKYITEKTGARLWKYEDYIKKEIEEDNLIEGRNGTVIKANIVKEEKDGEVYCRLVELEDGQVIKTRQTKNK